MNEQIKQIAERIREIREISGISSETMADKLGVPGEKYALYEEGETDIPVGMIFNISELFNVELSVLLGGRQSKTADLQPCKERQRISGLKEGNNTGMRALHSILCIKRPNHSW